MNIPEIISLIQISSFVIVSLGTIGFTLLDLRNRNVFKFPVYPPKSFVSVYIISGVLLVLTQFYNIGVCHLFPSENLCIGEERVNNCNVNNLAIDCYQLARITEKKMKDYERSEYYFQKSCDLNYSYSCLELAVRKSRDSEFLTAVDYARKACTLGLKSGCYNSACYNSILKIKDESLKDFRKTLEMGVDNWEFILTDEDLTYLRSTDEFKSLLAERNALKKITTP